MKNLTIARHISRLTASSKIVAKPTSLDTLSDEHLIQQVQMGDHGRMGLLYERYHKDLYAYFYRCTSDALKSEDLVHNVFFKVLKNCQQFSGKSKFVYWLFTIARNLQINDYHKKDPLRQSYELNDLDSMRYAVDSPSRQLEKSEQKELLQRALNYLSPEKKEAIVLSRFQGMKYQEIAQIAGCKESAIKSRIKRGLEEMREIMERLQ
ncbi:MAG: RNA polymerase sigma factor [Bacteroidota bacterium]